jgi:hypothetical protein
VLLGAEKKNEPALGIVPTFLKKSKKVQLTPPSGAKRALL